MAGLKIVLLGLTVAILALAKANQNLKAEKLDCMKLLNPAPEGDSCWKINFNNEYGSDVIVFKRKYNNFFTGKFQNEVNGEVIATGDLIGVTTPIVMKIRSRRTRQTVLEFNVDSSKIKLDASSIINFQWGFGRRELKKQARKSNNIQLYKKLASMSTKAHKSRRPSSRQIQPDPKVGYKITIQPFVDTKFVAALGENYTESVKGIFDMVKMNFLHESLKPVMFDLDVRDPVEHDGVVDVSALQFVNLIQDPKLQMEENNDVNLFVYMTSNDFDNFQAGVFVVNNQACSGSPATRVVIIDRSFSDLLAVEFVTMGIGGFLGIGLDYNVNADDDTMKEPKLDSAGMTCTDIGGFMDAVSDPTMFTTCSIEDLTALENEDAFSCLKPIECPGMDTNDLCPIFKQDVPNACETDWIKEQCPFSCDSICGLSANVAGASLEMLGSCSAISCGDSMMDDDMMNSTMMYSSSPTTDAPSTTMMSANPEAMNGTMMCQCPGGNQTQSNQTQSNGDNAGTSTNGKNCLNMCNILVIEFGCGFEEVNSCCQESCTTDLFNGDDDDDDDDDDYLTHCAEIVEDVDDCHEPSIGGAEYGYCREYCLSIGFRG